uniref:Uncharacterized protein n=1 Tax=Arundo donax TaxID=35708 RepID=A0A0A9GQI1_ARUDO
MCTIPCLTAVWTWCRRTHRRARRRAACRRWSTRRTSALTPTPSTAS